MAIRFRMWQVLVAAGASSTLACSDALDTPTSPADAAPRLLTAPAGTAGRPGEEHFANLAAQVPSFGGYFYEGSKLVAYVADPRDDPGARAALGTVMRNREVGMHEQRPAGIEIRRGAYRFTDLAAWRDSLNPHISAADGIVYTDVDETANRVTVGVDRAHGAAARSAVAGVVARLGLPASAVTVVETTPLKGDVASSRDLEFYAGSAGSSLFETSYPVRGGLGITFQLSDGSQYGCTLGFLADFQGARRFVTNSHCSGRYFGGDGQAYAQGGTYIGSEWHDFGGWTCVTRTQILADYVCRESDSNFSTSADPYAPGFGKIARTTYPNGGGQTGGLGSTEIDPNNPSFIITGTERTVSVGDQLDKVGARTGWTWGTVTRTCVNLTTGERTWRGYLVTLECQHLTNYIRDHGDSGAPVFRNTGAGVVLYGVHRGSIDDGRTAVYSGYRSIEYDEGVKDKGQIRVF